MVWKPSPSRQAQSSASELSKAAVAERHDRYGERAVSVKAGLHKLEQLIRKLACIGRHTEDDKVARGKLIAFLARGGSVKSRTSSGTSKLTARAFASVVVTFLVLPVALK